MQRSATVPLKPSRENYEVIRVYRCIKHALGSPHEATGRTGPTHGRRLDAQSFARCVGFAVSGKPSTVARISMLGAPASHPAVLRW